MRRAIPVLLLLIVSVFPQAETDSVPVPPQDSSALARAKLDSLRNDLEKTVYTDAQQRAGEQCDRRKAEIIAAGRKSRNFARLDSLLKASKTAGMSPHEPEVQKLLIEKFALEQKMRRNYEASPEGMRCAALEAKRKRRLDSALAAHPDYREWQRWAEPGTPR